MSIFRYELFVENSRRMAEMYPYLSEDVLCRVELLNAKWDILQMKSFTKPLRSGRAGSVQKGIILSGEAGE